MIPGFRYHIATISAIFLALGIGIIIGSSFVKSAIVERQTKRLEELKSQFNNEVVALREDNQQSSDFIAALTPRLIGNQLKDVHVALVQVGDYPDTVSKIRDTLQQAGAVVTSVTTFNRDFAARLEMNLTEIITALQKTHPKLTRSTASILRTIAFAIAKGEKQGDMNTLSSYNVIDLDGEYSHKNNYVILVGGSTDMNSDEADNVVIPFIKQLKRTGVTTLYAEPTDCDLSYVGNLSDTAITTVDDTDTDIGRLTLVLAMHSPKGNYGVKKTAQNGILPPFSIYHDIHSNSSVQ
jgi:hypothetical protein